MKQSFYETILIGLYGEIFNILTVRTLFNFNNAYIGIAYLIDTVQNARFFIFILLVFFGNVGDRIWSRSL